MRAIEIEELLKQIYPDSPVDLTKLPEAYRFPDGSVNNKVQQLMREEVKTAFCQGESFRKDWQKRYPNLAWLQKERLFIRNYRTPKMEIVLFCQRGDNQWDETIVNLEAQHKALLLFLLEEGDDGLDRRHFKRASERILEIYSGMDEGIRPKTETTKQFNNHDYNDWFHKLRTAFNEATRPYGLKITKRGTRYVLERPRDVLDEKAYTFFLQEKERRATAIEKEVSLWRKEEMQRIESYKKLSPGDLELLSEIAHISTSPVQHPIPQTWFDNTKNKRIIWYVEEKRVIIAWCCIVDREVMRKSVVVELPARELALLLLFASHFKDGIELKELLPKGKLEEEYMRIYREIGGSKENPKLESSIKKKPLQTIKSLMSSIKRNVAQVGFYQKDKDGQYYIEGLWVLIRL